MIKAIIIDDNSDAIDYLKSICQEYIHEIFIMGSCTSVEKGIALTNKIKPELVFLDIEINNKTGFDYLNSLEEINFDVIFTTGYDNYAIRAIKYAALDYLLKPISKDELIVAIEKYKKRKAPITQSQMIHLLENINSKGSITRLSIPNMNGAEVVQLEDVLYFNSSDGSTLIQTKEKKHIVHKSLKNYIDILNKDFFKTHREYIVNLNHVKQYFKGDGSYAKMSNGDSVKVSVRLKSEFLKALGY